ncbi:MAG: single-stranded DNA-binding protein [Chamaesiphon sp.]|nr:single-stranded DNA-binding protein [Chamaesiphon sp.]
MSINSVQLFGRLGQDPEAIWSDSGLRTKGSLAVTIDKTTTDWYALTAFGKTAEILANFTRKGEQIAIEGRIALSSWVDGAGNPRSKAEIVVESISLIAGNPKTSPTSSKSPIPVRQTVPATSISDDEAIDQIPF